MKTKTIIILLFVFGLGCSKSNKTTIPLVTISDISFNEGNGGTSSAEIIVSLDVAAPKQLSITWSTIEGSAKHGSDLVAVTNQTLNFAQNEKQQRIIVSIVADDLKEADEIFQIKIQGGSDVSILKNTIAATIKNDDTKIAFNNAGYEAASSYTGYTLAWSDEFNTNLLSTDSWTYENGDGCPALCGWGNNELQYYAPPPNNLYFQDGKMIIEAKAESFGGKNYTSARIKTQGKKSFKFGRIDIRAILPKGKGIWPAFWMLPQDNVFGGWPRSGEIDMMENIGSEPNRVSGTLHFGPGPGSIWISRGYTLPSGQFADQFHVFSLEWVQDEIRWYVDDNLYTTISKADLGGNNYPFNEKFYFLINLAVGGNLPGPPDATTVFPQYLIIDYIRIYQ